MVRETKCMAPMRAAPGLLPWLGEAREMRMAIRSDANAAALAVLVVSITTDAATTNNGGGTTTTTTTTKFLAALAVTIRMIAVQGQYDWT